jgi:hypothetical protein
MGRTTLRVISSKIAKHDKTCFDNKHVFIPFPFNNFDFLTPEVVNILKRVQKVLPTPHPLSWNIC